MNYMRLNKCIINQLVNLQYKTRSELFILRGVRSMSNYYDESSEEIDSEYHNIEHSLLYDGHIQTSNFQKVALAIGSSITSILDPRRHDMIAILGETTGHTALSNMYSSMLQNQEGLEIITNKPTINTTSVDLNYLQKLNENTLGFHYYTFLNKNNVTPDSRMPVKFVDDAELAYVMQRYREIHDLVHTLLGMPTNMQGEVAVKWVEAFQTGLPMCYSGAIFGPLRFKRKQRMNYLNSYLHWALRVGRNAKPMINIYFEKRWHQNIDEIRKELHIEPFTKIL